MPAGRDIAPLVVTPGEPAGCGAEIALKAWAEARDRLPPFFLMEDPERIARLGDALGLRVPVQAIDSPAGVSGIFPRYLPVLPVSYAVPPIPGRPDPANAPVTISAIEEAVRLTLAGSPEGGAGEAAAVVTLPIQKSVLYEAGFRYPGHTEFLAALAGPDITPVMMLAAPVLKVVPVTIHIPLAEVPEMLSTAMIVEKARITAAALKRDFGCPAPRLAIAGLDPHAGEDARIGTGDRDIVAPAVAALRAEGIDATGPLPADTMFHEEARRTYDAAICMYHDQALIPVKTLDFHGGVNVTLGLPFIRTSPDHGTALSLAGTGKARADSLIAALYMAGGMARARAAFPHE